MTPPKGAGGKPEAGEDRPEALAPRSAATTPLPVAAQDGDQPPVSLLARVLTVPAIPFVAVWELLRAFIFRAVPWFGRATARLIGRAAEWMAAGARSIGHALQRAARAVWAVARRVGRRVQVVARVVGRAVARVGRAVWAVARRVGRRVQVVARALARGLADLGSVLARAAQYLANAAWFGGSVAAVGAAMAVRALVAEVSGWPLPAGLVAMAVAGLMPPGRRAVRELIRLFRRTAASVMGLLGPVLRDAVDHIRRALRWVGGIVSGSLRWVSRAVSRAWQTAARWVAWAGRGVARAAVRSARAAIRVLRAVAAPILRATRALAAAVRSLSRALRRGWRTFRERVLRPAAQWVAVQGKAAVRMLVMVLAAPFVLAGRTLAFAGRGVGRVVRSAWAAIAPKTILAVRTMRTTGVAVLRAWRRLGRTARATAGRVFRSISRWLAPRWEAAKLTALRARRGIRGSLRDATGTVRRTGRAMRAAVQAQWQAVRRRLRLGGRASRGTTEKVTKDWDPR